ncbi:MAG: type I methionyl aminopeptidase [Candidatus Ancillula sp.]|jgi:methionyl aminopeptidase|nr:type I methionyl aminopeptidase [Candidatus Ancillula sp.]
MIEIRTKQDVEDMKPAGAFVAEILQECNEMVKVGTNLLEIDELVHKMISHKKGAKSCYVDYAPDFATGAFEHYICLSVNDAVLHGKPYDYNLQPGDLLSLDLAVEVNGWCGDSAFSIIVGEKEDPSVARGEDQLMIDTVKEALRIGIENGRAGKRLGDISWNIGEYMWNQGYDINTEYGGHGIGHVMHGDPLVPNDGKAGRGYKLRPGLIIAIEPWICETTDEIYTDEKDGWTIRSVDGSRGAHWEHTIAITDSDPIILTKWD